MQETASGAVYLLLAHRFVGKHGDPHVQHTGLSHGSILSFLVKLFVKDFKSISISSFVYGVSSTDSISFFIFILVLLL